MTNHLKAEIIYYNCATDFEFEFSMNSLCQMRLLSEASNDRKTMLTHLSRAVSRSRAIFIISPFNDEFIETISHSIGFDTETLIADEYGITQHATDKFITSGVPLVTEDGIYAGIILECGPQSLILLTDDRSVRKRIMKSLVNQYILDLCNCEPTTIKVTTVETTDAPTEVIIEEETESAIEDIVKEEIDEIEILDTATDAAEEIEENLEETEEILEETEENAEIVDFDTEFYEEAPDIPKKENHKGLTILTVILSVILFLLVAFIVYSLVIEPMMNGVSILENLKRTFKFLL